MRNLDRNKWLSKGVFYHHIGIYAYKAETLRQIARLQPSELELAESLEQLRWLERGYIIRVARCDTASIGIDTPEDLEKAERWLQQTNVSTNLG